MTVDEMLAALGQAKEEFGGNMEVMVFKSTGFLPVDKIGILEWFPANAKDRKKHLIVRIE